MKVVIQRVKRASVTVNNKVISSIENGFLLLIGIGREDTKEVVDKYLDKIIKMRIFADSQGKTNLSLGDVNGEILAVSQFTLYADCKKGNRPNFLLAASPDKGRELYEYFLEECKKRIHRVEAGEFGADMEVSLINEGPFTIVIDENTFN